MACTKIFSGNLPEVMSKIIQYFQNDYSTLHSCILVNRLWCRLAIPLLWEDPFSLKYPKNYRYIEVYLNNLNENERTQLNKYGINNGLFLLNPLFNYTIFIHHLDTCIIKKSIEKWVATVETSIIEEQLDYLRQKNNDLNYTKLIYKLLLQIFVENKENHIYTFKTAVVLDEDFEYFDDAIEIILQNPSFICNIRNLILDFEISNENTTKFMKFISSKCNYISLLHFSFPLFCNTVIEKHLSQIIDSQQNLKKILFSFNNSVPLHHSLLSLKNSNCANTLRTIIFYYVNFKNIVILNEVFEKLNVLESIHIYYCSFLLNSGFIEQIINLTRPFYLKSLFVDELIDSLELLQLLLQKSGNYLENFGLGSLKREVLDLIIRYCTKIKFLEFRGRFKNQAIYKIFQLIEKVKLSLNYLIIDIYEIDNDVEFDSILLQNLGQILPSKLEYLNLELTINISDFEIFLKNSQNTFIKKLLIKNIRNRGQQQEGQEIETFLPYIKEYIMKKKRTEYLAFQDYIYNQASINNNDLVSLKDEVKEFRLYNIIVQNYFDLNINVPAFINEMY
ncbi:hypothetical protein RclHR1_14130002 [Rhizophagus clarus]|uniref:F-box domain-containing protein n=1 Tax=Rhizophagus clarus TaxID=94130 RepID=A0A2Z6QSF6_9GLOM|nr:hypothetical protein RclHR1_14130002 [Rhizophagus clarus]GES79286.1 hypothetical protein GLOIN_2v1867536 [Rhizophagus clarus]